MEAVTVMVLSLGGTPEEADKVWDILRSRPTAILPSHFICEVQEALRDIRT